MRGQYPAETGRFTPRMAFLILFVADALLFAAAVGLTQ